MIATPRTSGLFYEPWLGGARGGIKNFRARLMVLSFFSLGSVIKSSAMVLLASDGYLACPCGSIRLGRLLRKELAQPETSSLEKDNPPVEEAQGVVEPPSPQVHNISQGPTNEQTAGVFLSLVKN